MLVPVILSGGAGTRLWPVSTQAAPKQFHRVVGAGTLIQATASRLERIAGAAAPIVVCNERHTDLVAEQLAEHQPLILTEPEGKNTAPAIAAACHLALATYNDPILAVLPSDHLIADLDAFGTALSGAAELAGSGLLVTFGVVPNRPATGYGYIQPGAAIESTPGFRIDAFHEKPDVETATGFVAAGHLWNSGMFVFRARAFLEELERIRPDIAAAVAGAIRLLDGTLHLDPAAWGTCPAESIDYAVMEHTDRGAVLPLEAGWNDVGTWATLFEIGEADATGNVVSGDVLVLDSAQSYVRSESRLVVAIGLDDIVIVETPEAVVVAHKDRTEDLKTVVGLLPPELR